MSHETVPEVRSGRRARELTFPCPLPCPNPGVRTTCSERLSLELNLPSSPGAGSSSLWTPCGLQLWWGESPRRVGRDSGPALRPGTVAHVGT